MASAFQLLVNIPVTPFYTVEKYCYSCTEYHDAFSLTWGVHL